MVCRPALRSRCASALPSPVTINSPPIGPRTAAAWLSTPTHAGETRDNPCPSTIRCLCPVRISAASSEPRSATVSSVRSPDTRISAIGGRTLTSQNNALVLRTGAAPCRFATDRRMTFLAAVPTSGAVPDSASVIHRNLHRKFQTYNVNYGTRSPFARGVVRGVRTGRASRGRRDGESAKVAPGHASRCPAPTGEVEVSSRGDRLGAATTVGSGSGRPCCDRAH